MTFDKQTILFGKFNNRKVYRQHSYIDTYRKTRNTLYKDVPNFLRPYI